MNRRHFFLAIAPVASAGCASSVPGTDVDADEPPPKPTVEAVRVPDVERDLLSEPRTIILEADATESVTFEGAFLGEVRDVEVTVADD